MNGETLLYALRLMAAPILTIGFRVYGLGCKNLKKALLLGLLFIASMTAVSYYLISLLGFYEYSKFAPFLILLPMLFYIPYISTETLPQTFFMHFTSINFILVLVLISGTARAVFNLNQLTTLLLIFVMGGPLLLLTRRYFAPHLRFMAKHIHGNWWHMMLMPIVVYLVVLGITTFADTHFHDNPMFAGGLALGVEMAYVLFLYILYQNLKAINDLSTQTAQQDLLRVQVSSLEKRLTLMENSARQMSYVRHDQRHFEATLLSLVKQGHMEEVEGLLEQHMTVRPKAPESYCTNAAVNAAMSYYVAAAQEKKVTLDLHLDVPASLPVSSMEFAITLSNLMENALKAVQSLPPEQRRIKLVVFLTNQLMVELENPCAGEVRFDETGYPVAPENSHGTGTKSVLAFVKRYNGQIVYSCAGNVFRVRMIL